MNTLLRIFVATAGFALLAVGAAFALVPEKIAADFAVASTGRAGLGTLRADLGGLFVGIGVFALVGARPGRAQWLAVPLAFVAAILLLRLGHLLVDGLSEGAVRSIVTEAVLLVLFAAGRRRLDAALSARRG